MVNHPFPNRDFQKTHKVSNVAIIAKFVSPYLCCFLIYLTIMMLVNVKLDLRGYPRTTFQGCIFHWSASFLMALPKRSWQHSGGANEKTASLHTCALFSPKDGKCLPNLFSLRTFENSFLHLLLVGKHSNVAYTSDNVTKHFFICIYKFENFKMEDGSNRSSKPAHTIFTNFTLCHLKLIHLYISCHII